MLKEIVAGFHGAIKLWPETWTINTVYTLGDVVKPTTYNSHTYKVTIAGTSHATTEPTWVTTNGATQTDGTVTWTCCDEKCFEAVAKQSSSVPYVVYGLETERPDGTLSDFSKYENFNFWVNCFSNVSQTDVKEIADEVLTSLDNTALTVTGFTSLKCQHTFIGSLIVDTTTTYIYQIPMRFIVKLDKS